MEHHERAGLRLLERAAHGSRIRSRNPAARGIPRDSRRRQHPGRGGIEVDLVPEAQRIAGDPLVPGLARDHGAPRLERQPARELQARVGAARALGAGGRRSARRATAPPRRARRDRALPGARQRPAAEAPCAARARGRPGRRQARRAVQSAARPAPASASERRADPVEVAQVVRPGPTGEPEGARERRRPADERQRAPRAARRRGRPRAAPSASSATSDAGSVARSRPSTTSGTWKPTSPASALAEIDEPLRPEPARPQRRDRARGGHDVAPARADQPRHDERRTPSARATSRRTVAASAGAVAGPRARGRRPSRRRPESPAPNSRPRARRRAREEHDAEARRARSGAFVRAPAASSPASSGKPVTSGIRKLGGGPVAVMSAM